ncbi:NeuD/PglB/VioB family sugar acetyltransferase [Lachnospiraceae bacterium 38-10]
MCITKDTVIVGYSGFAKEIEWLLKCVNRRKFTYNFLGFIDRISGKGIVGDDQWVCDYAKPLQVIVAIADCRNRYRLISQYKTNPNIIFPNIVEPSVKFDDTLEMGQGNIICANNILTVDVKIGNFNIINLNNTIGHECIIGDFVTINPGCNISGNVSIKRNCFIGSGVTILQGKTIGEAAIIGAGAVVIDNIMPGTTNVGIPAKEVKK